MRSGVEGGKRFEMSGQWVSGCPFGVKCRAMRAQAVYQKGREEGDLIDRPDRGF
jgi:hypothetical protein